MSYPQSQGIPKCLYPLSLTASGILLNGLVIGFSSPHNTLIRLGALPLIIAPTWYNVLHCTKYIPNPFLAGVLLSSDCSNVFRYVSLALMRRWSFENDGPLQTLLIVDREEEEIKENDGGGSSPINDEKEGRREEKRKKNKKRQGGVFQRLKYGLVIANSTRHVGTPYQVKGVPRFSSSNPTYIPSRSMFIFRTASTIAASYFVLKLLSTHLGIRDVDIFLLHPSRIPILGRLQHVTSREIIVRTHAVIRHWTCTYTVITFLNSIIDFIGVASFCPVKDFPPSFGSITEAYTIRQFWGVFWQQHLQNDFSDPSTFLLSSIPTFLPPHTFLRRYIHTFIVFFLSGIYHQIQDCAILLPCHKSHTITFFVTQAFGIFLEDHVQQLFFYRYRRFLGSASSGTAPGNDNGGKEEEEEQRKLQTTRRKRRRRMGKFTWARKVVGYIWVSVFMIWSTPAWFYPAAHEIRQQAAGIP